MAKKEEKFRIEINFDLFMDGLDQFYPGGRKNRRSAYREIKKYLMKKGFFHPLFSGYLSKKMYNDSEINRFINDFFDVIPWAENCMKACHITVVRDEIIDALFIRRIYKEMSELDNDFSFEYESLDDNEAKMSLDNQLKRLESIRDLYQQKANEYSELIKEIKNMER